jgi:lipoate---protein ligase
MDIASLTSHDAERHLAREWQMFQSVESGHAEYGYLTWEALRPMVVVGRGGRPSDQVLEPACRADDVPVLRRASGGGAVVLAPGCLNYAVILPLVSRVDLLDVAASFRIILDQMMAALEVPGLTVEGTSDLVLEGRKVGGSAQRRGRRAVLHHGTLLYAFDAALATRYLAMPPRQPAYRAGRPHEHFLANLPLSAGQLKTQLDSKWFHTLVGSSGIGASR